MIICIDYIIYYLENYLLLSKKIDYRLIADINSDSSGCPDSTISSIHVHCIHVQGVPFDGYPS